jgi:hypothetical protein
VGIRSHRRAPSGDVQSDYGRTKLTASISISFFEDERETMILDRSERHDRILSRIETRNQEKCEHGAPKPALATSALPAAVRFSGRQLKTR